MITPFVEDGTERKDWCHLSSDTAKVATAFFSHIARILNAFSCILIDLNPLCGGSKAPLVTLPSPSSLSPIRRKVSTNDLFFNLFSLKKKNSLLSIEMILKSQLSIVLYTNLAFIQIYSFSFVRFKNMMIYLIRSLIDLKWFMSYLAEFFLYY